MTPTSVLTPKPVVTATSVIAPTAVVTPTDAPSTSAPTGQAVTLADDGTTVTLAVGQRFLLNLGSGFDWTVTVADPSVVDRVRNVTVIAGAQGLYQAKSVGRTELSAIGDPPCRKSTPACGAPSRAFKVELAVH